MLSYREALSTASRLALIECTLAVFLPWGLGNNCAANVCAVPWVCQVRVQVFARGVCMRVCELRTHEILMSSARHLLRRVAGEQSKAGKKEETEKGEGEGEGKGED